MDDIGAAAYEPDGGLVDASRYTLAGFAEAVSLGVEVRIGAVEQLPDGPVVVAAGCWSPELLQKELPVELHRMEIAVLRDAPVRAVVSDAVTNVVTRPVASSGAWVVTYAGSSRYGRRRGVQPRRPRSRLSGAGAGGPSRPLPVAGGRRLRRRMGRRTDVTPDWNPVVGWVRDDVFAIAGMSSQRAQAGAGEIAESAAAVIAGREPPIDLRPLRFERFAEGDLLSLAYGPGARA